MADRLQKGVSSVRKIGGSSFKRVGGFLDDFKNFLMKGNVLDLAVAFLLGVAFQKIVTSTVEDLFSPVLSLIMPQVFSEMFVVLRRGNDGASSYTTRAAAKNAGAVTLNYGNWIQTLIDFLIVGLIIYLLVKLVYGIYHKEEAVSTDWPCPKCKELVKEGAIRCSHCAAEPIFPAPKKELVGEGEELLPRNV